MLRAPRLLLALALGGILPALAAAQEPPPAAEHARWITDLAEPGETGTAAVERLKALRAPDPKVLEAAAGEFEPSLARRCRSRAILRFWKETGTPYEREIHFLLSVASWELGKDAPSFLAAERDEARDALAREEATAIPVFLATYPEEDYPRYTVARDLLVKRGEEVIPFARKLLDHAAFVARLRAVHLLALVGGPRAVDALSAAATDTNATVRKRVLEAWVEAGDPFRARTAEFLGDADPSIRVVAVRALDGVEAGAETLGPRLEDDSYLVRKAAAEILPALGRPGFVQLLDHAGRAGTGPGRLEAIRALGLVARPDAQNLMRNAADRVSWGLRAEDAVRLLRRLLKDGSWAVRASAAEGLALADATDGLDEVLNAETHPFPRFRLEEALGRPAAGPPADPARFGDTPPAPELLGLDALAWQPGDEKALTDALTALKITRKDLEFDRNLVRDEFRFPLIQKALDQPLALAGITRDVAQALRAAALDDPAAIPGVLASLPGAPADTAARPVEKAPAPNEALASLRASNLPSALVEPLAVFLSDLSWAAHVDAALSNLTEADRAKILSHVDELGWDPELLPLWKKTDVRALQDAFARFVRSASALADALGAIEPPSGEGLLWSADTPRGRIVVAGTGADVHTEPCLLLVDLGGDDRYEERAAAGALGTETANAFAVVVDLSGDDQYCARKPVAQGAGFLGLAVLVDRGGRDRYQAEANSQGLGWFGGGCLLDAAGDDRYELDRVGQGAGGFGLGALRDGAGDDVYYARAYAQGFGFTGGVGALAECAGNDLYYVDGKYLQYETMPHRKLSMCQGVGYGMRPHASGGLGILWEGGGDDVYRGNAYAQGTSYWFAMGILVDEEGYDNYSAKIYSQASGIHMGVGVLADLKGDDNYLSWGLSQSGSHDLGVSWFLDAQGDDIYTCHDAALGGAINHAVALFLDRAGRDAYFMKNRLAVGAGDQPGRRDWGSLAVFLDLGGAEDTYPARKGGNGRFWTDGNFGVGLDR